MKKSNKTPFLYQLITFVPMVGAFIVLLSYMAEMGLMDLGFAEFMMFYFIGIFGVFGAIFIQTIIHEGGHLVFGLKSGYQFSSFRIGSIAIVNENGKNSLRRYSLAGTAGQCLMVPPELVDGYMPTKLYNWGGVLANIIVSTALVLMSLLFKKSDIGYPITVIIALIGYYMALQNGIPAKVGGVANDGYNATNIGKDKKAIKAFYTQLKINALQMQGVRLKDMKDYLYLPDKGDRENHLVSAVAALYGSYLMDLHKFDEVKKLDHQLIEEGNLIDIHRYLLQCDLMTIDLLEKGEKADLNYFSDNKFVGFYKKMLNNPAVLRTEYAINTLANKDEKMSEKTLKKFEKLKKNYMIPVEIESEQEIIKRIQAKRK